MTGKAPPQYRKHSSGQARVTLAGKDFYLGKYGSSESYEAFARVMAEYAASQCQESFGVQADNLMIADVLLAYLAFAEGYYSDSAEYYQYTLTSRPIADLYGSTLAIDFGPMQFRAVRAWWMSDPARSRGYINQQMTRTRRIVKWAVGEGLMPAETHTTLQCVDPLRKGRCAAPESTPVECVADADIDACLKELTPVLRDMVQCQRLLGCRPAEICSLSPGMLDRSQAVWLADLTKHKTAWRGLSRTLYIGPRAQALLAPYLLRVPALPCFSPQDSEVQRLEAVHAARVTPMNQGNRPGSKRTRKPRRTPGIQYTTCSYRRAIQRACVRAEVPTWSPNQLRHTAATELRKQFGLDAASVILGHRDVAVTQVYAEQDRDKAIEIARQVG